jgi:hypothetical protein
LLGKPVLDGDVFSFNPSKLAHLLPQRLHEGCATRRVAWIQVTYAEDFARLLRYGGRAKRKEHGAKRKAENAVADYFHKIPLSPPARYLILLPVFIESPGLLPPTLSGEL